MPVPKKQRQANQRAWQIVDYLDPNDAFDDAAKFEIRISADPSGLDDPNVKAFHRTIFDCLTSYVWDLETRKKPISTHLRDELVIIRRIAMAIFNFETDHHVPQMAWCSLLAIGILEWLAPTVTATLFDGDDDPDCGVLEGYTVSVTPGHVHIPYAPQILVRTFIQRLRNFYGRVVA
ncbi:hypothetical protein MAPG_03430 [Magnaporthiopsis poae ATCC 64411]|uniref:Uncharacterized protein n=1 Tax=Magnaporthiopsis poae (strain ATCC 64411 / 73-15) TaxID=644358 RepID=A0A0C4DTZ9_MAGP6|nr:hypothetical protein MAPG_03430 [Magnaporthiopsis poae ATCC 64411]